MKIRKSFLLAIFYMIVFAFTVAVIYNTFVTRYFSYMGFSGRIDAFSLTLLILLGLILTIYILPKSSYRILLFMQLLVPVFGIHLLHISGVVSDWTLTISVGAMLLLAGFYHISQMVSIPVLNLSVNLLVLTAITVILFYLLALIYSRGVTNIVLSFSDVYEYREEHSSTYFIAVLRSAALAFSTVLFSYAIVTQRWQLALFCTAVFVLFFLYSGHKRFIFLIAFIMILGKTLHRFEERAVIYTFVGAATIAALAFLVLDSSFLATSFIRRVVLIPALLTEYYVDYFDARGFLLFAHSKLGVLFGTYVPTLLPPAQIIGSAYLTEGVNANCNWIGSAYMNAGVAGVIGYATVISMLFSLPDRIRDTNMRRVFLISAIVIYSSFMQNSDLVSSFISNGVAFFVLIFVLWGGQSVRKKGNL